MARPATQLAKTVPDTVVAQAGLSRNCNNGQP